MGNCFSEEDTQGEDMKVDILHRDGNFAVYKYQNTVFVQIRTDQKTFRYFLNRDGLKEFEFHGKTMKILDKNDVPEDMKDDILDLIKKYENIKLEF